jgi:MFS family permease
MSAGAAAAGPLGVIVAGVLGYWAMSAGQSTMFAVMKTPTKEGVGLSELEMSSYFSAAQLGASLLLPAAGVAVDKYGIRRTIALGVLLMAAACAGMATVSSGPGVGVGLCAIRLCCKCSELPFKTQVILSRGRSHSLLEPFYQHFTQRTPNVTVVPRQVNYHWRQAKGRAMAVVSLCGNQLGSQIMVPLAANVLVGLTDWRTTYRVIAASTLVIDG